MAVISSLRELNSQTSAPISANEAIHGHPEPGPATGGRFYKEDEQRPSIVFKLCPNPTKLWNIKYQDWIAYMDVKCSDVPRLMREGFHWDDSNVIKEEGYLYAMLGFNMIYDKMPMEGFWPWPRKRNEAYVKDGADEVADEKLVSVSTQTYSFEDSVRWKRNLIDFEEDPNKGK
ncbi:hypothetical protein ANO14919_140310 [Xylariales sp. No.14919]|nr:hypothetical protein ANO14919_140310 [Xylariales sp. No.14919]